MLADNHDATYAIRRTHHWPIGLVYLNNGRRSQLFHYFSSASASATLSCSFCFVLLCFVLFVFLCCALASFSLSFSFDFTPEIRDAFALIDQDNDGEISSQEILNVMRNLGRNPTEDEVQQMINEADEDGAYGGMAKYIPGK